MFTEPRIYSSVLLIRRSFLLRPLLCFYFQPHENLGDDYSGANERHSSVSEDNELLVIYTGA